MTDTSRIPEFRRLSVADRVGSISQHTGCDRKHLDHALANGGLDHDTADLITENAIGTYSIPFGVALNFVINDKQTIVPMAVEEPSVVAAASNAAKMVRRSGGFTSSSDPSIMSSQVQVYDVPDLEAAVRNIIANKDLLINKASRAVQQLVDLGGGPRDIDVRTIDASMIVVHIHTDCKDAMGANMVNTIAESLGPDIARFANGTLGLCILSNLCDQRLTRAECRVSASHVAAKGMEARSTVERIVAASRFAELDPYRAATHNKGIMNGIDPVVIATGNDWRAVEAGAHAYAARSGRYAPLATWNMDETDGETFLIGKIELPLSVGVVGGTLRVHRLARLALRLMDVSTAAELAQIAACAGLASNLAALRALATEGIQRGHMALHARHVDQR